ncbi:beta-lactamase family protein [Pochonia chlamydosporia 170]|uniref:Beta-lactamase family protein n=1 Tax=Pochonia chlamydosporia 170 TaxID=1380566 RepID=A0A219AT96_METCM|nr:beta-lactamase family protein [Pochonia chlamydosporia 170]OWT43405.1 beta-lactamase family protein [Pochonia chlamydosporia 170]
MDLFTSAQFGPRVEGLLQKFHAPGVSIAIVQNSSIVSAGYGLVNLDPPKPMTADVLFDIASASKSLTAASVALLVHNDGHYPHVTYEATMSSLLPEDFVMSDETYTKVVTVEDMLSHRTGIAPHDESYLGPNSPHTDNAKSVTRNLRNLAVAAPIRTKHLYCNMMYTVATHLIETVASLSFADFLQRHFFNPLGMNSTNLQPARARAKGLGDRITPGYVWDDETKTYNRFKVPDAPEAQGAGSIITSVNDYVKYVKAIMNQEEPFTKDIYEGLIRSRSLFDPDYKQRTASTSSILYAAGWEVTFYRGFMIVGHGGSIAGAGTRHF